MSSERSYPHRCWLSIVVIPKPPLIFISHSSPTHTHLLTMIVSTGLGYENRAVAWDDVKGVHRLCRSMNRIAASRTSYVLSLFNCSAINGGGSLRGWRGSLVQGTFSSVHALDCNRSLPSHMLAQCACVMLRIIPPRPAHHHQPCLASSNTHEPLHRPTSDTRSIATHLQTRHASDAILLASSVAH